MRHSKMTRTFAFLGLWALLALPVAYGEDKVVKKVGDNESELTGIIIDDSLRGVMIKNGQVEIPIKSEDVGDVQYAVAPDEFAAIRAAMDAENWAEARSQFGGASRALRKVSGVQQKLLLQYFFYYVAETSYHLGDMKTATEYYGKILATKPDSRFYFQAKLGETHAYENAGRNDKALEDYGLWVTDFERKKSEFKLSDKVDVYILLAKVGKLRMQVKASMDNKDKLREYDTAIEKLARDRAVNDDAREEIKQVKALIWRGLEQWKELVAFLDKEIKEAQLKDKREPLFRLYSESGDANFALENYRAAALDYMRLVLVYNIDGEDAARVHFNLGMCFKNMNPKEDDWIGKARRHFTWAKSFNIDRYSLPAKDELKALKEQEKSKEAAE